MLPTRVISHAPCLTYTKLFSNMQYVQPGYAVGFREDIPTTTALLYMVTPKTVVLCWALYYLTRLCSDQCCHCGPCMTSCRAVILWRVTTSRSVNSIKKKNDVMTSAALTVQANHCRPGGSTQHPARFCWTQCVVGCVDRSGQLLLRFFLSWQLHRSSLYGFRYLAQVQQLA